VSIDTYSQEQSRGSNLGVKGHKMLVDLPPSLPASVITTGVKTNLGQVIATAPKVSALVAENVSKLQRHLEQGLASGSVRERIAIAADDALAPERDAAVVSRPSLSEPSIAGVVKVSTVRTGFGQSTNGSVSSGRTSSSRSGPLSGLLH
jgi:hypothetical protein